MKEPQLFSLKAFPDARGFFTERYSQAWAHENLPGTEFVQDNFSRSKPGVLRGLHFQIDPAQGKLVTCMAGEIFDVAVDLRVGSAKFGRVHTAKLSGDRPEWFWVPPGFAHGFCVLGSVAADVFYKVTGTYNPRTDSGIFWNDPDLKIPWPLENPIVSAKDQALSSFKKYQEAPVFVEPFK